MTYAHTRRILLAAVAVLPLLVPPSALSYPPGLTATKISSAKVCGASECREVSDPEAATALAVGPRPRGTDAPERGLPWYKSTYTLRAEDGGDRVSVTVVPSAGLMRWEDGMSWVTPPSEDASAARPGRPRRRGRRGPERGHPGAGERRLERLDRRAGRRRASGTHGGVAAQHPPPPRVDAASGARGTGVGTVRHARAGRRSERAEGRPALLCFR